MLIFKFKHIKLMLKSDELDIRNSPRFLILINLGQPIPATGLLFYLRISKKVLGPDLALVVWKQLTPKQATDKF